MRTQKLLIIATMLVASYGCENSKGTNSAIPVSTPVFSPTPSSELQHTPATQSKASNQLGKDPCIPIEESRTDNVFDPSKLRVGDRFMGLKVTKIDASCETSGYNGEYLGTATFQGKIIVSGVYDPKYGVEGFENVCFDVASQDDPKLPRMWGDPRTPWFCFDNPDRARQLLGAEKALLAKIVIDNFTTVHEHKGVINRADLVGVVDTITIKP
jgi:hypothetical protein